MQQWECIVCGWIYDEQIGDPDSGIAPGTKFEDIPDDWLCPECGVGKDDFELVDIPDNSVSATPSASVTASKPQSDLTTKPIVIVGTGLAGYGLLKEFRKLDQTTPIIMITSDDGRAYSKPALSTGYTKGTSADDLCQMDAGGMAAKYDASIWTFTQVTSIDTTAQRLTLNLGAASCDYSKLVLATGAQCIQAPLTGNALDEILSINNLLDYAKFQATVEQIGAKRICLIGAGLIGCEYANDLLNGGFDVEIVDPMQSCLPNLLPTAAGKAVQAGLSAAGANFHLGKLVTQVNKIDAITTVKLDDGSEITVDLVVSAIGVRPNTALAEQAGLKVNRGICTNALLETSAPNVYALGDNTEVDGYSLVYVAPLLAGSRALAQTLTGTPTRVVYPAMPVIVKTPACPVTVCPPPLGSEGEWVIVSEDGLNVVAEFENPQGETIGFALTGEAVSERARLTPRMPDLL